MLIKIKPHHIARFHHFLNGVPLAESTVHELALYRIIRDYSNVGIQVVEGLDSICEDCKKEGKPDEECREDPSGQEKLLAEQYNLKMRERPYTQSEFFERMRSSMMWESVNNMAKYLKREI